MFCFKPCLTESMFLLISSVDFFLSVLCLLCCCCLNQGMVGILNVSLCITLWGKAKAYKSYIVDEINGLMRRNTNNGICFCEPNAIVIISMIISRKDIFIRSQLVDIGNLHFFIRSIDNGKVESAPYITRGQHR